jgi:hypothetical protein
VLLVAIDGWWPEQAEIDWWRVAVGRMACSVSSANEKGRGKNGERRGEERG